jgi:beta-aspartyl-dipeptidase (metallo-type)
MRWLHIKNAHVYAPEDLGVVNVVIWNGQAVSVGLDAEPPSGVDVEVLEAEGRSLLPGLVDPHAHIMGASGVGGPLSRSGGQPLSALMRAGITTVVSPLGTDSLSRTLPDLLMRAETSTAEGVTAFVYTGGWCNPVPTVMDDAQADVAFLPRVLGIKVAIAEAMAPPMSVTELEHYAHAAVIGGRFAGKQAVLHAHIGDRKEGLQPLWDAGRASGLPLDRFVATHVNRNPGLLEMAADFAKAGGSVDVTGQIQVVRGYGQAILAAEAILQFVEGGVPFERVTLSTDSGGSYVYQGEDRFRMAEPGTMWQTVQALVQAGMGWTQIASVASHHAANLLGLLHKGRICEGADADLLLLSADGNLDCVWSGGRLMVRGGDSVVKGDYE